jgi:hypothetical protein
VTDPAFREHERRFNVWMASPSLRGWSCVAEKITAEQAEVYRNTLLFQHNIEEIKKEG